MSGRESGKIVEKSGPNSIRWLTKMCRFAGKVLAQFKLSTFNGTAPTVQNYPFLGFWKVLYLRTNSVVVGKIERNLKPRVVAVAKPSIDAKSPLRVVLLALLSCSFKFPRALNLHKARWRVLQFLINTLLQNVGSVDSSMHRFQSATTIKPFHS